VQQCQCTERFALLATKWQAEAHLAEALVSRPPCITIEIPGHVDVGSGEVALDRLKPSHVLLPRTAEVA
jgi:hypothetical protein